MGDCEQKIENFRRKEGNYWIPGWSKSSNIFGFLAGATTVNSKKNDRSRRALNDKVHTKDFHPLTRQKYSVLILTFPQTKQKQQILYGKKRQHNLKHQIITIMFFM